MNSTLQITTTNERGLGGESKISQTANKESCWPSASCGRSNIQADSAAIDNVPSGTKYQLQLFAVPIKTLDRTRKAEIDFFLNKAGKSLLQMFLHRHPDILLKGRMNLEGIRQEAMNPVNTANHFAHLQALMSEQDIYDHINVVLY